MHHLFPFTNVGRVTTKHIHILVNAELFHKTKEKMYGTKVYPNRPFMGPINNFRMFGEFVTLETLRCPGQCVTHKALKASRSL